MPIPSTSRFSRHAHGAVMLGVLALLASPAGAQTGTPTAATAARTYAFDLPAASLTDTIRAIGRLTGASVEVDPQLLQGKRAPAVSGTMSAEAALDAALAGSGFKVRAGAKGYVVVGANAPDSIVVVVARRDQAETSFKADRSDTATRSGTSLMEVPAGITILTSKVLETQQATSIQSALANVSGMSFKQSPQGTPTFGVRGFGETSLTVNGVGDPGAALSNVLTVERVEVLKGPQAILSGAGSLGGGVNVVTKKPQADPIRTLLVQAGSHRDLTVAGDIAGAVGEDRRLTMRVIAADSEAKTNAAGYDGRKDVSLLPQLRWKDDSTDLIVGVSYGKQYGPVPEYTFGRRDGVILPSPDMLLGRAEDGFDTRQRRMSYQLDQAITPDIVLVSRLQRSLEDTAVRVRLPLALNYPTGAAPNAPDGTVLFMGTRSELNQRTTAGDHYLRIQGATGPVGHKLSVGFNHNDSNFHQPNWSGGPPTSVQVYPPAPGQPFGDLVVEASHLDSVSDVSTQQRDVYAQDLMSWGDWSLLVNLRRTHYSNESTSTFPPKVFVAPKATIQRTTPGVGLVYALSPEVSLYTNYAEGFVPSTLPKCGGGLVPPKSTRNREAGAKFDLFDSKLSVTTAAYELEQSNSTVYYRPGNCYNVRDAQITRGVELDVQGEITRGLNALMNYSFTTVKDVVNPNAVFTGVPKHKISVWATYTLQDDDWRGLGFGLGMTASSRSRGSTSTRYVQYIPGQAQIDATVFYAQGPWTTTFGVKNVGDRRLYATTPAFEFIPVQEGRNFMLTVKREFN